MTNKDKGKLHQLLAVLPDLKKAAGEEKRRIVRLFSGGNVRFAGQHRQYHPLNEDGEEIADEIVPLATTVLDEIDLYQTAMARWIDAAMQQEATNAVANAVVDFNYGDLTHVWTLPATAWLNLEGKLAEIKAVYQDIPVLDPTKSWKWNEDTQNYEADPDIRYRTEKQWVTHVAYEATEQHPAQVESYTKDVPIGRFETTIVSGSIPLGMKRELLARIDELIVMVKKARQRANDEEIVSIEIGRQIFDYIHNI